jgi:hypothetical protein
MSRTNQEWVDYFRWNGTVAMRIPWHLGADLRDDERALIARSIAIFQLGESGEGRHLFRFARAWAERSGDDFYCEAARLHIAEEGRHSAVLRRFMNLNSIAAFKGGSSNAIFKTLRNALGSLEISIAVLVSAELIAKVYYPALRMATQSEVLRALCDQIHREEIAHVEFQTEQLARLRVVRSHLLGSATRFLHRLLYYPTVLTVWMSHRRVLKADGLTFATFWSHCSKELGDALTRIESYRRALRAESSDPAPCGIAGPKRVPGKQTGNDIS